MAIGPLFYPAGNSRREFPPGIPAFAELPAVEEVLGALEMDKGQIAELSQGQPIAYA